MPNRKKSQGSIALNTRDVTDHLRQIASDAVERWYREITDSMDTHVPGNECSGVIDRAFEDIEHAIETDYIDSYGAIEPDDDVTPLMIGREAGYLIGVQVGLRLRTGNGNFKGKGWK